MGKKIVVITSSYLRGFVEESYREINPECEILVVEYKDFTHISSIYKEQKIQGFSYRSFLDCFEWEHGYTSQSGLVQVDFDTQERIPKESYYAYQKFLKTKETK